MKIGTAALIVAGSMGVTAVASATDPVMRHPESSRILLLQSMQDSGPGETAGNSGEAAGPAGSGTTGSGSSGADATTSPAAMQGTQGRDMSGKESGGGRSGSQGSRSGSGDRAGGGSGR